MPVSRASLHPSRLGFTAIEMIVVLTVLVVLSLLAVPSLIKSAKRYKVEQGAQMILTQHQKAQRYAQLNHATNYIYGVVIRENPLPTPSITADVFEINRAVGDSSFQEYLAERLYLPSDLEVFASPLNATIPVAPLNPHPPVPPWWTNGVYWYYTAEGYPTTDPVNLGPADIGVVAEPVQARQTITSTTFSGSTRQPGTSQRIEVVVPYRPALGDGSYPILRVATQDAQIQAAIAIYSNGLAVTERLP